MRSLVLIAALMAAPAIARDTVAGYLPAAQARALLRQIPEPPAPGSAADTADRQRYAAAASGVGNAAGQQLAVSRYRLIAAQPAYRADVARARAELAAAPRPKDC